MSTTIAGFDAPIVALACEDMNGEFHIFYCEEPIKLRDLDFQDELIRVGDFYVLYHWFISVVVCTEEVLQELKQELQNA